MSTVPAVTLSEGMQAIDSLLTRAQFAEEPLTEKLHHLFVRERATIKNDILIDDASRKPRRKGTSIVYPGPSRVLPGPVQAILLDPTIPDLRDDAQLAARVRNILDTVCKREPWTFWVPLALVPLTVGLLALAYTRGPNPEMELLLCGCLVMGVLTTTGAKRGKPWLELGYHRPRLNDAVALARFRRDYVEPAFASKDTSDDLVTGVHAGPRGEDSPSPETRAGRVTNSSHGLVAGASPLSPLSGLLSLPGLAGMPLTEAPAVPDVPADGGGGEGESPLAGSGVISPLTPSERDQRIAEVHAAVTELDEEWLEYQLDLHAWYFAKPQLRNIGDPVIKASQEAYANLRQLADGLTSTATDHDINAAHAAARTALKTWGEANAHALAIGVSSLSPSEEAALARLHRLVAALNDRATPKSTWPKLVNEITGTLGKLTTVPVTLADIGVLPVIRAESRLRALTSAPHSPVEPPE